jgi:O-antigen ligase
MSNKENAKIIRDPSIARQGGTVTSKWHIPVLIGLIPAIMAILPGDLGHKMTASSSTMRSLSLHVMMAHILLLLFAVRQRLPIMDQWRALPAISKYAIYGLLAVTAYTSIAVSPEPAKAIISIVQTALLILVFLTFEALFKTDDEDLMRKIWLAIGVGVGIYMFIWFLSLLYRWPSPPEWRGASVPGLNNVRGAGFFALAAVCASLAFVPKIGSQKKYMLIAIVLATIGWGTAFWTGSRGAFLASLVAIAGAIFWAQGQRLKIAQLSVLTIVMAIVAVWPLPYGSPDYGLGNFFGREQTASVEAFTSGRTAMWLATLEMSMERPLLGIGLDQFQMYKPEITHGFKQPHNWPIQIFFTTGIAGLILLPITFLPLLPKIFGQSPSAPKVASFAFLAGFLVFSLYDAAAYYLYPLTIATIALAMLRAGQQPAPDKSD